MRFALVLTLLLVSLLEVHAQQGMEPEDWWTHPETFPAVLTTAPETGRVTLENGLVRRSWRTRKGFGCVAFDDLVAGASMLRGVRPEARLVVDGETVLVGGLGGQPNQAFLLPEWERALAPLPGALVYRGHEAAEIEERLVWKRVRHHAPDAAWPPRGAAVVFRFGPPEGSELPKELEVRVRYELYDGIPLIGKRVSVVNGGAKPVELDRLCGEILALVEEHNWVELRDGVRYPAPSYLHAETDYAFGGFVTDNAQRQVVHWRSDPEYHSQVNWAKKTPCLLETEPLRGPDVIVGAGETFRGFWTFELVQGRGDRESRGLAQRRMYRVLAPWATENPLILHVVSTDPKVVRRAIDQAAECGFEMVSLSFGSGLSMEDASPENHAKFRALVDYAQGRGIHLGGYSLLASRRIKPEGDNCINPKTGKPGGQTFGFAPALASTWGQAYFRALRAFHEKTGFLQFTHDGSYPGDWDARARPPRQRGLHDSQWVQWSIITEHYRWLRARGVYLRVPDFYYLQGANECGMGYREVNWSLPRAQQVIHTRQNIFDGTWTKTPSMGWMFVPLTQYHGGGAAATIEPLDEHLDHYERMLASNLAFGVQAVYRGTRLYDTPRVREAVRAWVGWYKHFREVLEADLLHGRRADGRDLDWVTHVNPGREDRAMIAVFNPTGKKRTRTIRVPLRRAGLNGRVRLDSAPGPAVEPEWERTGVLDARGRLTIEVSVPPGGMRWIRVRATRD